MREQRFMIKLPQIKYLAICAAIFSGRIIFPLESSMPKESARVDTIKQAHGMEIEQDLSIPLRDGSSVCADVFRPIDSSQPHPVILTYGPYCKDMHFIDFNPTSYSLSPVQNEHMVWETPDPETWTKEGYIIVRIDQRGSGKSAGQLRILSSEFANDLYDVIEWLGTRSWSNGKVGMLGVSYYAVSQWIAASMNPPHLAAIIPWEGFADAYRDAVRHGGIPSDVFMNSWYYTKLQTNQHGKGFSAENVLTQYLEIPNWPKAVVEASLATNPFWTNSFLPSEQTFSSIQIPVYSSGNWGGFALHGKGNITGFQQISSKHKWLQMHTGNYVNSFYGEEGVAEQKRFFDKFLKGIDNDMLSIPPIQLAIRYGSGNQYTWRYENEWPLARTQWTSFYLDANTRSLNICKPLNISRADYDAKTAPVTFLTTFAESTEITGPIKLKLWVSSTTDDIDFFIVLKKFDSNGKEMIQVNATHTPGPVAKGWLRASHRKLDANRSKPYQPYLTHDEILPLIPGEIVPVEIEVWPTSMVFEAETSLAVVISSMDDRTAGRYLHKEREDQTSITTIWTGSNYDSHILLPLIPN
jgi:uncharacterized protein